MTKETKVGLLVGLAFIILFAIILSEKGPPQKDPALPNFRVAESGDAGLIESGTPLQGKGHLPIQGRDSGVATGPTGGPPQAPETLTEEFVAQVGPNEADDLPPLPPEIIRQLNDADSVASAPIAREETPIDAGPVLTPPSFGSSSIPAGDSFATERRIPMARPSEDRMSTSAVSTTTRSEQPPVVLSVHTVQAGESLGKIAARYYGRATPDRIKAITEANKDVIKDVHKVRENDKLKIPKLAESFPHAFEPATSFAPAPTAARPTSSEPRIPPPVTERRAAPAPTETAAAHPTQSSPTPATGGYRIYEVRPGDTLCGIARRELGSERRSTELLKLNRETVPNPNAMQPGTKIRLPRSEEQRSEAVSVANHVTATR